MFCKYARTTQTHKEPNQKTIENYRRRYEAVYQLVLTLRAIKIIFILRGKSSRLRSYLLNYEKENHEKTFLIQ